MFRCRTPLRSEKSIGDEFVRKPSMEIRFIPGNRPFSRRLDLRGGDRSSRFSWTRQHQTGHTRVAGNVLRLPRQDDFAGLRPADYPGKWKCGSPALWSVSLGRMQKIGGILFFQLYSIRRKPETAKISGKLPMDDVSAGENRTKSKRFTVLVRGAPERRKERAGDDKKKVIQTDPGNGAGIRKQHRDGRFRESGCDRP